MNDPIVVTRTLIKRAWADVEPKVQWAFASGAAASFLLELAHAYGITLPPIVQQEAPYIFAVAAGYIMPSVGQTITKITDTSTGKVKEEQVTHGAAVSTFTAPTPVQPTAPVARRASFTDVLDNSPLAQDEQPTQVIPGTTLPDLSHIDAQPEPSAAAKFLSTLPSANATGPQSIDNH